MAPDGQYIEILEKLIGFHTVSSESNLSCIDYINDFLAAHHFKTERFYNEDKTKANLLAAVGPETEGGIMLAGHCDVVPVEGQDWNTDPFRLVEKEGRLYGRGTSDMKGFLALAMESAAVVDESKLQVPLYFVVTYDEEIGCRGAKALQAKLQAMASKPRFVLIGEPTNMALVTAHKGIQITTTKIRGKPAHSSCPHIGANAIAAAAKMIDKIASILPRDQDPAFEPPLFTYNIGTIKGGSAVNVIAEHCEFQWEFRSLPSADVSGIDSRLEELTQAVRNGEDNIAIENRIETSVPGLQDGENREAAEFLRQFLNNGLVTTAPFVTEAGLYQEAGIPAVVCGPGHVNQAHQPSENVSTEIMHRYRHFLLKMIQSFQG